MIKTCVRCSRTRGTLLNKERSRAARSHFNEVRCLLMTSPTLSGRLPFPRLRQDNVNMQKRLEIRYSKDYIQHKIEEYELGARRLARMMGRDPDTFTKDDVNEAISYLFPTDLFSRRAKPQMQHPEEVYPAAREVDADAEGRPSHYLFYTKFPEIYSVLSDAHRHLTSAQRLCDQTKPTDQPPPLELKESRWMSSDELEHLLLPILSVNHSLYRTFIDQMNRFVEEPYAGEFKDFIMKYRIPIPRQTVKFDNVQLNTDESGRKFTCAKGTRKTAIATVRLIDGGEGRVTINNSLMQDFFNMITDRECLLTPLVFVRMLLRFDVEATVDGGFAGNWTMLNGMKNEYKGCNKSAMAGAIRLAISKALIPFISEDKVEQMRRGYVRGHYLKCLLMEGRPKALGAGDDVVKPAPSLFIQDQRCLKDKKDVNRSLAGLLTIDPRKRERKKPGQKKARKKFTWKKR